MRDYKMEVKVLLLLVKAFYIFLKNLFILVKK